MEFGFVSQIRLTNQTRFAGDNSSLATEALASQLTAGNLAQIQCAVSIHPSDYDGMTLPSQGDFAIALNRDCNGVFWTIDDTRQIKNAFNR